MTAKPNSQQDSSELQDSSEQTPTTAGFDQEFPSQTSDELPSAVDQEELFRQWAQEDKLRDAGLFDEDPPRFSVTHHPSLLLIIALIAGVISFLSFPALEAVWTSDQFDECGDVFERRQQERAGIPQSPLKHQQRCELSGIVGTINIFAIGQSEARDEADPLKRNRGISYVVKLNGDLIFAILPAHYDWVESYRMSNGSLFGLELKTKGLMIDPALAPGYQNLEREIRQNLIISPEEQLWFFDLTYSPWDYKMQIATAALAPLITLLSLITLRRSLKWRKAIAQEEEAEQRWLREFEEAAQKQANEQS